MKTALILSLLLNSSLIFAQQGWIIPAMPESRAIGRLIIESQLNNKFENSDNVVTVEGPDSLLQLANRKFSLNITSALNLSNATVKQTSAEKIFIDYLTDNAIYTDDDYLTNYFVYAGARANSVKISIKKEVGFDVNPADLLMKEITEQIQKVFPFFDSLNIEYDGKDSTIIRIANPKVYFKLLSLRLKKTPCPACRKAFSLGLGSEIFHQEKFSLDILDQYSTSIFIEKGSNPTFKLYVEQDATNNNDLNVKLSASSGFHLENSNNDILTIPFKDIVIDGKKFRRFGFDRPEVYIGNINQSNVIRVLGFDVARIESNTPLYITIDGMQKNNREVEFRNFDNNVNAVTKIEYPSFGYQFYKGVIR